MVTLTGQGDNPMDSIHISALLQSCDKDYESIQVKALVDTSFSESNVNKILQKNSTPPPKKKKKQLLWVKGTSFVIPSSPLHIQPVPTRSWGVFSLSAEAWLLPLQLIVSIAGTQRTQGRIWQPTSWELLGTVFFFENRRVGCCVRFLGNLLLIPKPECFGYFGRIPLLNYPRQVGRLSLPRRIGKGYALRDSTAFKNVV